MRGRKPKPLEKQISEGDPRKKGKGKLEAEDKKAALAKLSTEEKIALGLPTN